MPTPLVLVCGYYGHGNVGDELILDVLLSDIETELPRAQVTVVTDAPQVVATERSLDTIRYDDVEALVDAATAADLIVIGGGGLFQDYGGADMGTLLLPNHWGMSYYAGVAVLGRLVGTPVAIYGIGVGPLETDDGRALARMAVEAADAVSVRDEQSKALIGDGAAVTADPVLALSVEGGQTRDVIGVTVRPWGDNLFIAPVAAGLDRVISDHNIDIEFIPFQRADGDDDVSIAELTMAEMTSDRVSIAPTETRLELTRRIGSYRAVVGMRLHSVMLASLAGVPAVGLAYDPKVGVFMDQIGRGDRTIALDGLESGRLADAVGYALDDEAPSDALAALRAAAGGNRQVIAQALSIGKRPNAAGTFLAKERLRREARILQMSRELEELLEKIEQMEEDYQSWAEDYQAILDSRAYGLVQKIWSVTGRTRGSS